jgi:hypothetical protein
MRFRSTELSLKSLALPRAEVLAALHGHMQDETAALKDKDDTGHTDAVFQLLLAGYLAARLDDEKLVQSALAADLPEARSGEYPVLKQMLTVALAEQLRVKRDFDQAIATLKPLLDGKELCIVHQALLDTYASSNRNEDALREAKWLAEHRGRAYAEFNVQRILVPLNVVQSDLALLRQAELATALGRKSDANDHLAEFRKAWPEADRVGFVAARLKALSGTVAAPGAAASAAN